MIQKENKRQKFPVIQFSTSLERTARTFDEQEIALLNEVRRLRQRLATENRNKKPPPVFTET